MTSCLFSHIPVYVYFLLNLILKTRTNIIFLKNLVILVWFDEELSILSLKANLSSLVHAKRYKLFFTFFFGKVDFQSHQLQLEILQI